MPPTIKALVVDLGDVLFSWQPPTDGKVSKDLLKRAMSTKPWYDFERGTLSEEDCYLQIEALLSIPSGDLADTIKQAKLSLQPDGQILSMLKDVKDTSNGEIKVYLMSNISQPHWEYVQSMQWERTLFDQIFTSANAKMRKPDLCFYKHVLKSVGLSNSPSSALFIDDKLENVCSARAVGMQGLIFDNAANIVQRVQNLLGNPVKRGMDYLHTNAKQLHTTCTTPTHQNIDMKENFAQLLILEATGDKSLVAFRDYHLLWNFFQDQPILTTATFPNDYDTTSLALTILDGYHPPDVIAQILDASLANQSADHLPLVYDDPSRPRFDPVVCVHIYTLFHLHHRGHEMAPTWKYIVDFLRFRAYEQGTYYYAPPEYFLYALARLVFYCRERGVALPSISKSSTSTPSPNPNQNQTSNCNSFLTLLRTRCQDHLLTTTSSPTPKNAISLALHLIASVISGIPATNPHLQASAQRLRSLQEVDGGWPWCEIYRAPGAKAGIGSRGVVTGFAVWALRLMSEKDEHSGNWAAESVVGGEVKSDGSGWSSIWNWNPLSRLRSWGEQRRLKLSTAMAMTTGFKDMLLGGMTWTSLKTSVYKLDLRSIAL
ncbi:hypothetical protein PMZ80_005346 [Knufia obscura]|uniref:HAD-like protein n=2 Tax=Knufia TaxID=430999 RepID=A0AAN8EKW0_9EURO|nr:hypothetical protein PMZ80_005346 [Knufia obscura]KAK5958014.1 hypothetical protein OHC33_001204 [Knufia fluminis]